MVGGDGGAGVVVDVAEDELGGGRHEGVRAHPHGPHFQVAIAPLRLPHTFLLGTQATERWDTWYVELPS